MSRRWKSPALSELAISLIKGIIGPASFCGATQMIAPPDLVQNPAMVNAFVDCTPISIGKAAVIVTSAILGKGTK